MAFISTCVGNGAASHHSHRSPSPRPGMGTVIADRGHHQDHQDVQLRCQITTVHFRLSPQESHCTIWNTLPQITSLVAFVPNQRVPSRQAWTHLVSGDAGILSVALIGGGDSGFRLWHRRGSGCPVAGSHSALWDAQDSLFGSLIDLNSR